MSKYTKKVKETKLVLARWFVGGVGLFVALFIMAWLLPTKSAIIRENEICVTHSKAFSYGKYTTECFER